MNEFTEPVVEIVQLNEWDVSNYAGEPRTVSEGDWMGWA